MSVMSGRPISKHEVPYHGPRLVFSRDEIERLNVVMIYLQGQEDYTRSYVPSVIKIDNSIRGKLHASLTADPAFTEPAK